MTEETLTALLKNSIEDLIDENENEVLELVSILLNSGQRFA